jgi:hypothetical protein
MLRYHTRELCCGRRDVTGVVALRRRRRALWPRLPACALQASEAAWRRQPLERLRCRMHESPCGWTNGHRALEARTLHGCRLLSSRPTQLTLVAMTPLALGIPADGPGAVKSAWFGQNGVASVEP